MVRRTMVSVGDDELDVEVAGTGEPVVVIQTALTADELRPLAQRMSMRGGYRVIHLHRRGYADSAPVRSGAGRGGRCGGLPRTDGHPRSGARLVCVVGASYSSAIALTLASTAPQHVRTLTVIEAPPVHVPSAPEFRSASEELVEASRAKGAVVALDEFMTMLVGTDWRARSEHDLPGSVAAMERDAATLVESDIPALLAWEFGTEEASRIRCPVCCTSVGVTAARGSRRSAPWLLDLLPQAEDATVGGAGHLPASTHPGETVTLVTDFLRRHPLPPAA